MQVVKSYEGTLENAEGSGTRILSYGMTTTAGIRINKANFINQTIADFLNECGVDVSYDEKGGNIKFLWIYGIPFLITLSSGSSPYLWRINGPFNDNPIWSVSSNTVTSDTFFNRADGDYYKFRLLFTGNPQKGFILRIGKYPGTSVHSDVIKVMRATNMLNKKDSVLWSWNTTSSNPPYMNIDGVDLNTDGTPDANSYLQSRLNYPVVLTAPPIHHTSTSGKYPLIPVMCGAWKLQNIYYYIGNFDLPAPNKYDIDTQCEIILSGRKFIITTSDKTPSGYLNAGLLEVED